MLTIDKTFQLLRDRERELEKKRIQDIAHQRWAKAAEDEARLDECQTLRRAITARVDAVAPPQTATIVKEDPHVVG